MTMAAGRRTRMRLYSRIGKRGRSLTRALHGENQSGIQSKNTAVEHRSGRTRQRDPRESNVRSQNGISLIDHHRHGRSSIERGMRSPERNRNLG